MENNQDNVSINRTMSKPVKCVYYAIVLFGDIFAVVLYFS